jgi:molybdopterin molybdotransferase
MMSAGGARVNHLHVLAKKIYCASFSPTELETMAISYEDALKRIHNVAEDRCARGGWAETVRLPDALGRVAIEDHTSPISTPPHDTSAMDGYAIPAAATTDASAEHPVTFAVQGTMAAGDNPITRTSEAEDGIFPCVEIMTGARFPASTSNTPFDACVKIEDTVSLGSVVPREGAKARTHITVKKPLSLNANRRFAGGDIKDGDLVLAKGQIVCSRHIMALASVGITHVVVRRKVRVAIWSTGNELSERPGQMCSDSQILNSNGPYLLAALRELGVDAEYRGILKDDPLSLEAALSSVEVNSWDVVITTGAVSKGKFDFIVPALEELRADIHFHGVAIRPGHPVLFGTTNGTPLFGLPGNPIATAACFRFLVVPFLRDLLGYKQEQGKAAQLQGSNDSQSRSVSSPAHLDCFRHGIMNVDVDGNKIVDLSSDQSPAIISQFAASNCWVHITRGHQAELEKAVVHCYPHNASLG